MTYSWTLTAMNKGDVYLDFVGTGSYVAYGYGFIALDCSLLTGTVTFTEKVVTTAAVMIFRGMIRGMAPGSRMITVMDMLMALSGTTIAH